MLMAMVMVMGRAMGMVAIIIVVMMIRNHDNDFDRDDYRGGEEEVDDHGSVDFSHVDENCEANCYNL